jgi:hypothetical protein
VLLGVALFPRAQGPYTFPFIWFDGTNAIKRVEVTGVPVTDPKVI